MSSTILTAIIGGICTIGGSIIAVFVTRILDNPMGFQKNERLMAVVGQWDGIIHQEAFGPERNPADHRMTIVFERKNRRIVGKGNYYVVYKNESITETLTMYGGLAHDRFLKLEYISQAQPGSIQFGFALFELSTNGQVLRGRFVGYASTYTGDIVSGTVELKRRASSHSTPLLPTTTQY